MTDGPQQLPFENAPRTPEEQEALARRFPVCSSTDVDSQHWQTSDGPTTIRLLLPPEYELEPEPGDGLMLWRAPDDSMLLLTTHDGDGRHSTMIAPQDGVEDHRSDPMCHVHCAGRAALVHLSTFTWQNKLHFTGSLDVGVHVGLGFGLAFLSNDADRRSEFLRIAELVVVER